MPGYLLIAPTGTGKSSVRMRNPEFKAISTDGDSLVDWGKCKGVVNWTGPDRKHLDDILSHMRSEEKCVCWYVGITAIADAIDEGRLSVAEMVIVLIPEDIHRQRVEERKKEVTDGQEPRSTVLYAMP
ncbi:hypothetical protein N9886_00790 [bacterium]|nr:hypothetical protein [bacterium]